MPAILDLSGQYLSLSGASLCPRAATSAADSPWTACLNGNGVGRDARPRNRHIRDIAGRAVEFSSAQACASWIRYIARLAHDRAVTPSGLLELAREDYPDGARFKRHRG